MKPIYPMLASPGKLTDLARPGYIYEPKLDGIRCIACIADHNIVLCSRQGKDITHSFPDVTAQLRYLTGPNVDIVLDGEIVVKSEQGAPLILVCDFQALQTRLQRKDRVVEAAIEAPATYIAFDLLSYEGVDQTCYNWLIRRRRLDSIPGLETTTPVESATATKLFPTYTQAGMEGFMAKERGSLYHPGTRSKEWLKIKPLLQTKALVGGLTHGSGRRKPYFGALVLGNLASLVSPELSYVGTVGSGLTDLQIYEVMETVRFSTLSLFLTDKIPNVKHWLVPTLMATVSYQEKTKDGKLRFPTLLSVERIK